MHMRQHGQRWWGPWVAGWVGCALAGLLAAPVHAEQGGGNPSPSVKATQTAASNAAAVQASTPASGTAGPSASPSAAPHAAPTPPAQPSAAGAPAPSPVAPAAAAAPGVKAGGRSVAIFQLAAERVETSVSKIVTDTVVGEARRSAAVSRVLASSDMDALLGFERQKQMLSCSLDSCMAELAGALGTDYLLVGSVGELGGTYLLNLKLLDVNRALAVALVNKRVKDQASLPDVAALATYDVFREAGLIKPGMEAPAAAQLADRGGPSGGPDAAKAAGSEDKGAGGPKVPLLAGGAALLGVGLLGAPAVLLLVTASVLTTVLPYFVLYVPTPGLPYAARSVVFPVGSAALGVVALVAGLVGLGMLVGGLAVAVAGFVG